MTTLNMESMEAACRRVKQTPVLVKLVCGIECYRHLASYSSSELMMLIVASVWMPDWMALARYSDDSWRIFEVR